MILHNYPKLLELTKFPDAVTLDEGTSVLTSSYRSRTRLEHSSLSQRLFSNAARCVTTKVLMGVLFPYTVQQKPGQIITRLLYDSFQINVGKPRLSALDPR